MHKYPESVFEPLASVRMLVYVLLIALVLVTGGLICLVA